MESVIWWLEERNALTVSSFSKILEMEIPFFYPQICFFLINNGEVQGIPQVIIPLYSVTRNKFKQDFLNGKRNLTIVFDH